MTLYEAIEEAFEQVGISTKDGNDARTARRSLMLLLKRWENHQINFWQMTEYLLNCTSGTASYSLGDGVIDLPLASVQIGTGYELDLGKPLSFQEYHQIPNKTQLGRPTQYMVHRQTGGATLYLWPVPNTSDTYIKGYSLRGDSVQQADGSMIPYDQSLPVPSRFEPALIAGLAAEIANKKLQDPQRRAEAAMRAKELWQEAIYGDSSRASVFIRPEVPV